MNPREYEAIIFDFDGVLAESVDVKTRAFAELYADYGPEMVSRVVAHHLAHGGVSRYEKLRYYHEEFLRRPLGEEERQLLLERFENLVEDAVVASDWVSGARECLEQHVGRVPLFVVSGTPQGELERIVERRGIARYFVSVHGSPLGKTAHLRNIIGQRGFRPRCAVVIGDSMTDYDAAMEVGATFIGRVPTGADNPFPPAVSIVPDLTDLGLGASGVTGL
ncbi:MAG: HAD family hydrolase, partial [Planctomycetes bacterium]|nr:HAD family hydrolase [Planctomycetota bacterium]